MEQVVFMVDRHPCVLAELLAANASDEALCEWAATAQVGDFFPALINCERVA